MKFIIEFDENKMTPLVALDRVYKVVAEGRISDGGESYCFLSRFTSGDCVSARKNKASDKFNVWAASEGL